MLKAFSETKNSPSKLLKVAHKDRCTVHVTSGEICRMALNELYLIFICSTHSNQRLQSYNWPRFKYRYRSYRVLYFFWNKLSLFIEKTRDKLRNYEFQKKSSIVLPIYLLGHVPACQDSLFGIIVLLLRGIGAIYHHSPYVQFPRAICIGGPLCWFSVKYFLCLVSYTSC